MTTQADLDRQARLATDYGVHESGMPVGPEYHASVDHEVAYTLAAVAAEGGTITRLRVLSEVWPGRGRMCDISYIHATLPGGKIVPVTPGWQLQGVALRALKGALIEWAKEERVYAKALGLLDEGNWSILY